MKNLGEYINESILRGIENTLADGDSLNEPFDYIYNELKKSPTKETYKQTMSLVVSILSTINTNDCRVMKDATKSAKKNWIKIGFARDYFDKEKYNIIVKTDASKVYSFELSNINSGFPYFGNGEYLNPKTAKIWWEGVNKREFAIEMQVNSKIHKDFVKLITME